MLRLDWNIVFTIINILILYWICKRYLLKPVMAIIEKRQSMIDSQMADAEEKQSKATELEKKCENILSGAKQESAQIIDQAKNRADKEYDSKVKEADKQAAIALKQAQENIEMERQRVMSSLKSEISKLALLSAEKILHEESTKELNKGIYNQFLAKAGELNDTD
ncbi:MAG: F0F1 ATP synthase subunit B [bacterium]|nr:F0F1 ATP synthase subunit B [bacterium]